MNEFAKKLKIAIAERGMTQGELAEKSGVTEASISRYVNGGRTPNLGKVKMLAECLNVSVSYLLGDEDDAMRPVSLVVAKDVGERTEYTIVDTYISNVEIDGTIVGAKLR